MLPRWLRIFSPELRFRRLAELKGEARFLADRHSRTEEFFRVLRIAIEFIRGFRALHKLGPAVTIFGSARFPTDHPYCELARKVGAAIAREGFVVITGGGPGIMQAANEGSKKAGGFNVGCNIKVPHEQRPNPYLDRVVTFYYFFVRKVMLVKYSYAFVILPGGMGTLDEMTEALTLIQTGKIYDFPVILVGQAYWDGFFRWARENMLKEGAVSEAELSFLKRTDDPAEVASIVRQTVSGFGLSLKAPQPAQPG
jgi:uncharacterized protein (TIGR00730 family)